MILKAAAQIIECQGEDAMTTTTVAARAGYSIGTIYQYFPDRDAILVAIIDQERQAIAAAMRQVVARASQSPAPDRDFGLLRVLTQIYARVPGAKRRRLLIISLQDSEKMSILRNDFAKALAAAWTLRDPDQARTHEIRAFVLAQAIWGAYHGAALTHVDFLRDAVFEQAVSDIVRTLAPPVRLPASSGLATSPD